uniref:Nucleoprotein TPR/MLP1 domain-containing protein n=1 Tax=Setaria digitata TaxID=48799 RepID=A0A915Q455_9BILA
MVSLNLNGLEELFEEGGDNYEILSRWYEELSKYDPEDSELPESAKRILKAMKWIMQYEHANAEELRELAEKEASEMVEKQENWEEERENMRLQLNSLREQLNAVTNVTDLSEAFRARINSLQEENSYLKGQNKERGRELAEKNDKAEKLSSQIEQLENERTKLLQQQAFLNDSIRELNQRLDNKIEICATNEAEAMKLQQRSQQAAMLSKQLQEVVQQNDELRAEIEQLSTALASATTFIEDTTNNYRTLRQQLLESDEIIGRLINDNELLSKKLEDEKATNIDKLENDDDRSVQYYQGLLQKKDEQIEDLQMKFEILQAELQELQSQSTLENNIERENEMERLRTELVEATKVARQLFGVTTVDELNFEIKQYEIQNNELVHNMEIKDAENHKVNAELTRLRGEIFGSAEAEINRLEKQLCFREQQIEKLTTECSLLQAELNSVSVAPYRKQKLGNPADVTDSTQESTVVKHEVKYEKNERKEEEPIQDDVNFNDDISEKNVDNVTQLIIDSRIEKRPAIQSSEKKNGSLESLEASAMIISSLNRELMLLLQELDDKDQQLGCMEKSVKQVIMNLSELKEKYLKLQEEVAKSERIQRDRTADELRKQIEFYEIEINEYKKLSDSIRLNGSEVEQKLEEMNRQVVAERLRNLQLVRKLEIVEFNRKNENVEHKKVEKSYEEQRLLHAKQVKIANYESDLASIELARLQTLLLHSVPRRDYDRLLMQHKQLLASDDSAESTHFIKSDQMETEYIAINFLEMTDQTRNAEFEVENAHLKEMVNVLTSQNEYWQIEVEKVREQNAEMTHFLEDVESESQVKSLLVALERRFLKALSDRAQFSQNQKFASHQFIVQQNDFAKKKRRWRDEKKKLFEVIRSLQLLLQRTRSNSMELITVQQMLLYKEKFRKINANYAKSEKNKEEIERQKEKLNLELRHVEALRKGYETLQENDYNVIKLRKCLQASHLNMINIKNQLENAEIQIRKKDGQIQKLEETVQNLERENEDLLTATFKISDFEEEDDKICRSVSPTAAEFFSHIEKELPESGSIELKKSNAQSISDEKVNLEIEESENMGKGETPTDTIDSESDAKFYTVADVMPKIVITHSDEYMKKLNYISETAKLCIANYKEQLKYKDEVIEKYKALLRIMPQERDGQQIINGSISVTEELTNRRLRTASEILSENYNANIEAKDMEIVKLRNEVEHFLKANRKLTKDLQQFHNDAKDISEANTQTEFHQDDDEAAVDMPGKVMASSGESDTTKMTEGESGKNTLKQKSTITSQIPPLKSVPPVTNIENDEEILRREESKTMIMRLEIRELKQRIATLRAENQLEKACESIRSEALSEIKHNYSSGVTVESEAIIMRLQRELSDLKTETGNQKKLIQEQKEVIDRVQKNQSIKNAQEEISKWHEKKARESNIDLLRRKLKEMEQREQEMCERLKKRDCQIQQLYKLEGVRSAQLKRLHEMSKKLKEDKETSHLQIKLVNEQLKTAEEANVFMSEKITRLKKENDKLLSSSIREKKEALEEVEAMSDMDKISGLIISNISDGELSKLKEKAEQVELSISYMRPHGMSENYDDLMRQIANLKVEIEKYHEENRTLSDKLNERKYDCGAVAVLRDKLMAKEKVIEQQQHRIEELEREKWQNLL